MSHHLQSNLNPLVKANLILLLLFLVIGGLYLASAFLIPLAFAVLLAMLLTPLCRKIESVGTNRALATLFCILLLVFFFLGLGTLLSTQIASFSQDLPKIEQQVNQRITGLQQYIQETFGVSPRRQAKAVQGESVPGAESLGSAAITVLGSFTGIMASSLLTLVYLFMLLYYRARFSTFILKVVSDDQKDKAKHVISNSSQVAQQYLVGRGILIIALGIMYSIGLSIVGLDNAVLLSLLAALVSIIPYVGNIIGVAFPLLMALAQGGDMWLYLGILIVFSIVQFVESYILEPYIVGAEVHIHPFFTIVAIIVGEMVWGIAGMILAIPLFGMLKTVFDNIESLKPYGYLIGDSSDDDQQNKSSVSTKIKQLFSGKDSN